MTVVAGDFGISDVALKKHCVKLNVPVPGVGYWQRKAAGYKVRVKRLPKAKPGMPTETVINVRVAADGETNAASESGPAWEQEQFEALPENRISVPEHLRDPHPLVRKTSDILHGKTEDGRVVGSQWRPEPRLDVDVSGGLVGRALRIMDALVKALERRGFAVRCGANEEPMTYAKILEQNVPFGVRETHQRGEPDISFGYPTQTLEYTGKLALVLRNSWGRGVARQWSDTKTKRIEDELNDFVVLLVSVAVYERELHAQRLREEEEREARRELARLEAQRQALEAARRKQLRADADDWAAAARIREFLAAVEAEATRRGSGQPLPEDFAEWLRWARTAADAIDPLTKAELTVHFDPEVEEDPSRATA